MTQPMTPYSTLENFLPTIQPTWIPDELEQRRVMSYQIYEQIYWNVPATFKMVARGQEDKPIYVPNARTIIEATNRYTAPEFGFTIMPRGGVNAVVNQEKIAQAQEVFADLFTRERFFSKFSGNKRYGLIRGDWLWHIVADRTKPAGRRISIYPLDPGSYFPIWDDEDLDRILGCHIIETFTDEQGNTYLKRLTYRKPELYGQPVTVEEAIFKTDDWNGPQARPLKVTREPQPLPGITQLPVYHIKNFEEPSNPFGSSELRGVERMLGAINQAVSDEELALALDGLGVYATDAPSPVADDGTPLDWVLGPGRVIEHPPGHSFNRVNGVGSVAPSQEHISYLEKKLFQATGVSEASMGVVDVTVAQSGISLALQFTPMIAKTNEKDQEIMATHSQMFYDLANEWFPAYEQLAFDGLSVNPRIGGKIPIDRVAKFTELNDMYDRNIISAQYYRLEASRLGFVFPEDMNDQIAEEKTTLAEAEDPMGARMGRELNGNADSGTSSADGSASGTTEN